MLPVKLVPKMTYLVSGGNVKPYLLTHVSLKLTDGA